MSVVGVVLVLAGCVLACGGAVVLFGAPAAVVCGAVLIAAGMVPDWEKVSRGKHPEPPPRT